MPKPTIVLVHGAWADGASWNAVSTALQGQGFTVLTPPNLLHGVAGDAAYVASFLAQRTTGPVVLVGHSYGGVVITNAGTAGGDVKALVYVDAFIPEVGETVFQILGGSGSAFDIPDPSAVFDIVGYPGAPEGDAEAFLKPSTVHESFAQDLPEADRWLIVASQRPITLGANTARDGEGGLEDPTELDGDRNRGPGHPPGHTAPDGRAGGLDDHRSRGLARIHGVPSRGCDRRHPRRWRCDRRLGRTFLQVRRGRRQFLIGFRRGRRQSLPSPCAAVGASYPATPPHTGVFVIKDPGHVAKLAPAAWVRQGTHEDRGHRHVTRKPVSHVYARNQPVSCGG